MSTVLLESGDVLLLESGDTLLLEEPLSSILSGAATLDDFTTAGGTSTTVPTVLSGAAALDSFTTTGGTSTPSSGRYLLLESGDSLLLESGDGLLLEVSDYLLTTATVTGIAADGGTAGVTFGFDPDATGTIYYVVGPAIGWNDPSPSQVAAGLLWDGSAADFDASDTAPADAGAWTDSTAITGLTTGVEYRVAFAYKVGSDYSNVAASDVWVPGVTTTLSGAATLDTFTTTGGTSASVGTITLVMVQNWARASLANTLIENVAIIDVSARTVTLELTNQTVGSDGNLSIVNAAIVAGTPYMAATWNTDGTVRGFARVVAT